ncbi:hypothetical protein HDC92_000018 [Pedobacter sp. AK017]|nr:hypothetical protein [Pedobacter sp. AK017]
MKYRPYDEIDARDYKTRINDFLINTGLNYKLFSFITAGIAYQFENQVYGSEDLTKLEDYSMRLLINRYYQPNSVNRYPVPIGGRVVINNTNSVSHQARAQLNFNRSFGKHTVSALAGWEIKHLRTKGNGYTLFGYQEDGSVVNGQMDFVTSFPQNPWFLRPGSVNNSQEITGTTDRFISSYTNLSYSFDDRYFFNGSIREDAANLFGVKSKMRGTPLWSIGANWQIGNEKFYHLSWLPRLNLRATYGFSGNINRNAVAFPIISMDGLSEVTGVPIASLQNPPNEGLRWERNGRLNLGLDLSFKNGVIQGSIEYYASNNKDLVAQAPIDGTLGIGQFGSIDPSLTYNVANTNGNGFDINIQTKNIDRQFKWTTNWIFSYANTKVTKYLMSPSAIGIATYISSGFYANPIIGRPLFANYAYRWAGLDPTTGDPQGYVNGQLSKDYSKLTTGLTFEDLSYFGPSIPTYQGGIRSTFQWKALTLSFNITSRFGYYIRRSSVSYNTFFNTWTGHSDYTLRWQKSGDEQITSVPSAKFPEDSNRAVFYSNSDVLMEKGDHIRLQDIQIRYSLIRKEGLRLPFRQLILNSNLSNLNVLLWKANKQGIDPNLGNAQISMKPGRVWSVGLDIVF